MLPYFAAHPLAHYITFAIAVMLGHLLQRYRAKRLGLDDAAAGMLSLVLVVGAAYGAHWLALIGRGLLSQTSLWQFLFPFNNGFALGGLAGGFASAWLYAHWKKLPLYAHLNAAAWAFPFPWAILRTGCFLAHDSMGRAYNGPLALNHPDGPRHDLAFYEILWALAFGAILLRWPTNPVPKLLFSYGVVRALIAPLRAAPSAVDWFGAVGVLVAGFAFNRYSSSRKE